MEQIKAIEVIEEGFEIVWVRDMNKPAEPEFFDIENAIDVVFEEVVEEVVVEEEVVAEEVEVKKSSRAKKVVCLTTGMVFDSMKAAAEYYGMKSANGISKCCNGKQKTSGKLNGQKLVWQFA